MDKVPDVTSRYLSGTFNLFPKEEKNAGVPTHVNTCNIGTKGWDTDPAWVFNVRTGESVLKGAIENAKLGTLTLTDKSYLVEATSEELFLKMSKKLFS